MMIEIQEFRHIIYILTVINKEQKPEQNDRNMKVRSASKVITYDSKNQQILSKHAKSRVIGLSALFSDRDIGDSRKNFKTFTCSCPWRQGLGVKS